MIYNFDNFNKNESFNNKPVLTTSRLIVNELKHFIESDKETLNTDYFTYVYDDVDVRVSFTKTNINGYDIIGATGFDEEEILTFVELKIYLNPLYFPFIMNDFIAELKDALRHEFEHTTQADNPNKHIDSNEYVNEKDDFIGYILSAPELPSFLYGFNRQARTKKTTIPVIIDDYFLSRKEWFDYEKDYPILRKKLIAAGKKLLPKSKW